MHDPRCNWPYVYEKCRVTRMNPCDDIEMCPINRGDTLALPFNFGNCGQNSIDLTGKILHFSMRLDPKQKEPDLHHSILFDPAVSRAGFNDELFSKCYYEDPDTHKRTSTYEFVFGRGTIKIPKSKTIKLIGGQCYFFNYYIECSPDEGYTIGSGKVHINHSSLRGAA